MSFKPTYKKGGTNPSKSKPSKNDRDMVSGVSSILRKIKDKKNRKEVAGDMVNQFNREGVNYNKEKFLKNSRSYQFGGASRADSLNILANSRAVQNYYAGRRYSPGSRTFGRDLGAFYQLNSARNDFTSQPLVETPTGVVSTRSVNYYTPIDRNRFRQREVAASILDTRSPMQLFDRRIEPTGTLNYFNQENNDPMSGDVVNIYSYDPLSVTPWDMLNTQQRKQRIDKYGFSGTPYKSKQEFIEKTSDPEVIRKQKLLKEAGLYKGTIDGDWGDKSKEAWKKYEESKKTGSTSTTASTSTSSNSNTTSSTPKKTTVQPPAVSSTEPWRFMLGNQAYITTDESTAKQVAQDLGITNLQKGQNFNIDPKTGKYRDYSNLLQKDASGNMVSKEITKYPKLKIMKKGGILDKKTKKAKLSQLYKTFKLRK